jgi:hypothetical protein
MYFKCKVSYKYQKHGNKSWTENSHMVQQLKSQSETLVMQKLHDLHKDCEIVLKKLEWV